jgi:hypothetical protein
MPHEGVNGTIYTDNTLSESGTPQDAIIALQSNISGEIESEQDKEFEDEWPYWKGEDVSDEELEEWLELYYEQEFLFDDEED